MTRRANAAGLSMLLLLTAVAGSARALDKRAEVVQQGDFELIGNTLAQDCGSGTPPPTAGTLDCTNSGNQQDSAPDVFWRAEGGVANANASITPDMAQSAAALTLPPGAEVTHAYVYWAAQNYGMTDNSASLVCLDHAGEPIAVQATSNWLSVSGGYNVVADVKDYVSLHGSCTYMVSGVTSAPNSLLPQSFGYAVWWMVVFYKDPSAPSRHLVIMDGLDTVGNGGESQPSVSGFLVPKNFMSYSKAKVGVVAYDGDASITGDKFLIGETLLTDALGDNNNFFNSSRSLFGASVSSAQDLPQLTGDPSSMSRLDVDIIDASPLLVPGQTQIDFKATSAGEPFEFAGLVTSIPMFTDQDADALSDDAERFRGTDPNDVDTDDDGVPDGQEGCSDLGDCQDPAWSADSDGDGLINALDPDSDNDGLYDGTELGLGCAGQGTDAAKGRCVPDADEGKTKTDPLNADTDGGGASDGSEDHNLNGLIDSGETYPTALGAADDSSVKDADLDGLGDKLEATLRSDPNDLDSDDDGLLDGLEANPACDTDGDLVLNVLDVDSDNDALYDGMELGKDCSNAATKADLGHCAADADPATKTSPIARDTDRGGASDASEDWNRNGALDAGELDPTEGHAGDDAAQKDADVDGLSDELETALGSGVADNDSDDDGAVDGSEANPGDDTDGDGALNVNDPDSDADGLFDGTERGYGCADPATDIAAAQCISDGDEGASITCMIDADSDDGGVDDGHEDFNKDGVVNADQGETDPNNAADDQGITPCETDGDCGPADSGVVCDDAAKHCIPGCRNVDGSRCPSGEVCSSEDSSIGYCIDASGGPGTGGGAGPGTGAGGAGGGPGGGGSCQCGVEPPSSRAALAWLVAACALALRPARRALRRKGRAR
jgi:hypothetical protein